MRTHLFFCISIATFISLFPNNSKADSTEKLISRFIGTASSLSNGNIASAANQVIPGKTLGNGSTSVRVNATSVGLRQGIPGFSKLNTPYGGVGAGLNAYGRINSNGQPSFGRNAQVSAGNSHVRNTTTFE